jgi:hypothetical protein
LTEASLALPLVRGVDPHRLVAEVRRVVTAAESLGVVVAALPSAASPADPAVEAIQRLLDRSCLFDVHINPEMRVKVARGPARPRLAQREWRAFLVKVRNEAGTTSRLRATSSAPLAHRWLDLQIFDGPPLAAGLSGLELEYRIVRLYSRESGRREATVAFDVGQGTQDLGFRNEAPMLFDCRPAV